MTWDDAIRAAQNDQGYDLSALTPEQAEQLFASKVDPATAEKLVQELNAATQTNNTSARKLSTVITILQTAGMVGRILLA